MRYGKRAAAPRPIGSWAALGQGVFYLVTGLWPLVSVNSFQKVTGPKIDLWLVKTVGVLITVIGAVLAVAGLRRRISPETKLLGIGSAVGFTGIDTVYVSKGRISPIYMADAVAELCLILLWSYVNIHEHTTG